MSTGVFWLLVVVGWCLGIGLVVSFMVWREERRRWAEATEHAQRVLARHRGRRAMRFDNRPSAPLTEERVRAAFDRLRELDNQPAAPLWGDPPQKERD